MTILNSYLRLPKGNSYGRSAVAARFLAVKHTWGCPARHGDTQELDGLFHGDSQSKMDDDWGYPHDYGNPLLSRKPMRS